MVTGYVQQLNNAVGGAYKLSLNDFIVKAHTHCCSTSPTHPISFSITSSDPVCRRSW